MLFTGLVDQPSVEAFEEKLDHLAKKQMLHNVDDESEKVSKFCSWLYAHKEHDCSKGTNATTCL